MNDVARISAGGIRHSVCGGKIVEAFRRDFGCNPNI
jgi:hypothetical protein